MANNKGLTIAGCIFLLLLAVFPYARTVEHEFVHFDDYGYIVENAQVRNGLTWEGLKWAFTSSTMSNWHPVTWLSHMADCQLFGIDPAGHHFVSILLHGINTVLLFAALLSLTGNFWPSLIVAALFAVHPLRVESVAWASERKDLLSGLFFMLTLSAYSLYARHKKRYMYLLVFSFTALGLLSKPMLVTLPAVLLLIDIWPLERWDPLRSRILPPLKLMLEKAPLVALSAGSAVATMLAQHRGGAVQDLVGLSVVERFANAANAYMFYLWKTVWPTGLAFYYPHPAIVSEDTFRTLYIPAIISFLALCSITVWACANLRHRPFMTIGWIWFLITLIPVIGLLQVGNQSHADRYAYLPLIGIYLAAAWGIRDAGRRWRSVRSITRVALPLVIASFGVCTYIQADYWRDSLALFTRAIDVTSDNYIAYNNLGNHYNRAGRPDLARLQYERALRIRPDLAEAHNNLGSLLAGLGDHHGALEHYRTAIRLKPDYYKAYFNIGLSCEALGMEEQAVTNYLLALEHNPDLAAAHERLGSLYLKHGRPSDAEYHLRKSE